MPAQITLPIVGTQYPNRKPRDPPRRYALELCAAGHPVTLRAEPDNEFDPYAIAVDTADGLMIGYIPAERALWIGTQMRRGEVSAIFQGRTQSCGWVRIAFDGETPSLPPVREVAKLEDFDGIDPIHEDWGA